MSTSTPKAEAAVLSTIRHITAKKWDKAASRLDNITRHLRDAESALQYEPGSSDTASLEADVLMLLGAVRKAFAGYLDTAVNSRSRGHTGMGRGRGRGRGRGGSGAPCSRFPSVSLEDRLNAIERMLWEAKFSGFSNSAMIAWRDELLSFLRQGECRLSYTSLFGRLTNEWAEFRYGELSTAKPQELKREGDTENSKEEGMADMAVGRKEMHEQRQIWERHVTNEHSTDTDAIGSFLDDLFHSGSHHTELSVGEPSDLRTTLLHDTRQRIASRCAMKLVVTPETIKAAIQGVLSADQLTSEKRRAMLDISNKENVLSEIADLLNIGVSLDSLSQWSWGDNPVAVQMRKAINGKYRVYLDLELLDAILIQCIGQWISLNIRDALSAAWLPWTQCVWQPAPNEERTAAMEKHITDFEARKSKNSIEHVRKVIYQKTFYTPALPKSMNDVDSSYDEGRLLKSNDNGRVLTDLVSGNPNRLALKMDILRLCSTELAVQKLTQGRFCVLQSDFEWFGPSLPHSTLIAIMEYFHFPNELVRFVKMFLSMRMKFREDGPNGEPVTRKTGIPIAFQLTAGIAELLLFVLDFAVNQRTNGSFLYRNHDDLWFWGQPEKCAEAWETICEFTRVMGLRLNMDKTGCAYATDDSNPRYVAAESHILQRLPSGRVKWGFLVLDPSQWQWTANKPAIKEHMNELQYQLRSRTAVMSHIQAYNAYIQNFLPNNFGHVIIGLGDSHANMILDALKYALQCLYSSEDSNGAGAAERPSASAAEHVREMIKARFGDQYDVPDCFLYMDVESGGLGLANPVPAFAQYADISHENPSNAQRAMPPMEGALRLAMHKLSAAYREDAKTFAERQRGKRKRRDSEYEQDDSEDTMGSVQGALEERLLDTSQFMSFSDYVATSEEHSSAMYNMYMNLVGSPPVAYNRLSSKFWISDLFHDELEGRFGGRIAEEEFLSLGLYRTLAEEQVRWEG